MPPGSRDARAQRGMTCIWRKIRAVSDKGYGTSPCGAEPLVVELLVLPALDGLHEREVHHVPEVRVVLPHRHAVRLVGEELADHVPLARVRRLRLQAGQLHAVVRVGVDLPLDERGERRRLVGEHDQLRLRVLLAEGLLVGRALLGADTLAGDALDAADGAALLHQELGAGHEEDRAEVEAVAPRARDRHRSRDEVDGAAGQERDARGRGRLLELELDRLAQLLLDVLVHELREVDREAAPVVLLVDEPERRGAGPRPDHEWCPCARSSRASSRPGPAPRPPGARPGPVPLPRSASSVVAIGVAPFLRRPSVGEDLGQEVPRPLVSQADRRRRPALPARRSAPRP